MMIFQRDPSACRQLGSPKKFANAIASAAVASKTNDGMAL
jgi:hypothetical protein